MLWPYIHTMTLGGEWGVCSTQRKMGTGTPAYFPCAVGRRPRTSGQVLLPWQNFGNAVRSDLERYYIRRGDGHSVREWPNQLAKRRPRPQISFSSRTHSGSPSTYLSFRQARKRAGQPPMGFIQRHSKSSHWFMARYCKLQNVVCWLMAKCRCD